MKKIITGVLLTMSLLTPGTFAEELKLISTPTLYTESEVTNPVKDLVKKYELVIRNNNLEVDYQYNNIHYYTSKMKSKDIIVPKEIQDTAKNIYFLVEEGSNRIFYANDAMNEKLADSVEEVTKEYNYRKVAYKPGQEEYVFDNKDLVKDFGKGEYKNVTITLIAEFSDTEKVPLSSTTYVSMNTKINVLENLKNENQNDEYYGYYNTDELEKYLVKISEKYTRANYKNLLVKADKKIGLLEKENKIVKDKILNSITRESDFSQNVSKYTMYSETNRLLSLLSNAVKNQLQNIRSFDAIDSIFN